MGAGCLSGEGPASNLSVELIVQQQPVDSLVQQRFFTFDESTSTIAEPALGWSTTIRALDDHNRSSLRFSAARQPSIARGFAALAFAPPWADIGPSR